MEKNGEQREALLATQQALLQRLEQRRKFLLRAVDGNNFAAEELMAKLVQADIDKYKEVTELLTGKPLDLDLPPEKKENYKQPLEREREYPKNQPGEIFNRRESSVLRIKKEQLDGSTFSREHIRLNKIVRKKHDPK